MTSQTPGEDRHDWIWPHDQVDPILAQGIRNFPRLLRFEAPRYSPLAWRIGSLVNRIFYLRLGGFRHGSAVPILPDGERDKLQAIPPGAGNILVGPHPGPLDPQLMFYLVAAAHDGPAAFLMAAEVYFGGSPLRRVLLNRLGVVPVARGRKNPDAVRQMSQLIASGWWGGIFPEGEVYFSRQVMPMEYGAVRIAVEAALEVQRRGEERKPDGSALRPVFLTPFAHVYFFRDPKETARRAEAAVGELESHPMVAVKRTADDLPTRLRCVADRLLENKANEYQIPREDWYHADRFERTRRLQEAVLGRLEQRYFGRVEKGYARRRAMRIRMECFERHADSRLPQRERRQIENDIQKTRELIFMTPFSRAYRERYNDLEMWVEYIHRFRTALGMPPYNFGPQLIEFEVREPIDVHPIASEYRALEADDERRDYLYRKTELVRKHVQAGVDEICEMHKSDRHLLIERRAN